MPRKYEDTVDQVIVFVEVAKKTAGNGIYSSNDWDTGGHLTFDTAQRCSADGLEPATHLMVSHVVDQKFLDGILTGVSNAPFFDLYKQSDYPAEFTISDAIESSLVNMNLQVIEALI